MHTCVQSQEECIYRELTVPTSKLEVELYLSYKDMGFNEAIVNKKVIWYKLTSYTIKENNDSSSKIYLHLNDFVTIQDDEYEESYAIIRGIIQHKGNDENNYVFIIVDWFENTGQEHLLLKCPFILFKQKIGGVFFGLIQLIMCKRYILLNKIIENGSKIIFISQQYNFIINLLYILNYKYYNGLFYNEFFFQYNE